MPANLRPKFAPDLPASNRTFPASYTFNLGCANSNDDISLPSWWHTITLDFGILLKLTKGGLGNRYIRHMYSSSLGLR